MPNRPTIEVADDRNSVGHAARAEPASATVRGVEEAGWDAGSGLESFLEETRDTANSRCAAGSTDRGLVFRLGQFDPGSRASPRLAGRIGGRAITALRTRPTGWRSWSGRVRLTIGRHELVAVNRALGIDTMKTVPIVRDGTTSLVVERTSGLVTFDGPPGVRVRIDGAPVGHTPITIWRCARGRTKLC
jgi:hypothetical protein